MATQLSILTGVMQGQGQSAVGASGHIIAILATQAASIVISIGKNQHLMPFFQRLANGPNSDSSEWETLFFLKILRVVPGLAQA
jgi:hypothetical protein